MRHSSPHLGGAVVAVLDRRGSDRAVVEIAAEEAVRRHVTLRLATLQCRAHRGSAPSFVGAVRSDWPGLHVDELFETGSRADTLARAGAGAQLLVVPQTLVHDLLDQDGCPVLVVPRQHLSRWHRVVVASVEERAGDEAVVAHAADEAHALDCELRLLYAYAPLRGESGQNAADRAHRYLFKLLAGDSRIDWLEVSAVSTPDPLDDALAQQAAAAELVVLGRHVTASRLLGLMRHCRCGILVVRAQSRAPGRTVTSGLDRSAHRTPSPVVSTVPR